MVNYLQVTKYLDNMNFSITLEIDKDAYHKSNLIHSLSKEINHFLEGKKIGEDILNYYIGCICIKTLPGYEKWYQVRNPKYKELQIIKSIFPNGDDIIIKKSFSNDIKIDGEEYDDFITVSDEESKKILAKKIIESLENLDKLPKKVKDFDKEKFKETITDFFKERNLI
ncbi:MAG: hypothetical protein O9303_13280 [Silanimonas sp.]|nr:hypothetical protein [Silanimonas sp.]